MLNKLWLYVKRPEGEVTQEHYSLVEKPAAQPGEGEVLLQALFISVDPYMRIQQVPNGRNGRNGRGGGKKTAHTLSHVVDILEGSHQLMGGTASAQQGAGQRSSGHRPCLQCTLPLLCYAMLLA